MDAKNRQALLAMAPDDQARGGAGAGIAGADAHKARASSVGLRQEQPVGAAILTDLRPRQDSGQFRIGRLEELDVLKIELTLHLTKSGPVAFQLSVTNAIARRPPASISTADSLV